jgi:hypothetical protein
MRRHLAGVLVGAALCFACPNPGAHAQSNDIPCDAFVKNPDDTWSALRNVAIQGTGDSLTIRQGSVLRPGAAIKGLDLATMLDQQCPATPEPAPASAQPAAPAPRVTLGSFANANGTIETQRLSCGDLADASPEEAGLFLAWYSGWYVGSAKKRGINLARVRSAIHTVIDYCRTNRDKKIVNVMDLMLK